MKRRIIFVILAILIVLVSFFIFDRDYFLFKASGYKAYNEKGDELPIDLFKRSFNHEYGRVDSPIIDEILLYIDDDVNMNEDGYSYGVLSITKKEPSIYQVNGDKNVFYKVGSMFLYQHHTYMADEFLPLYKNGIRYEIKDKEPIHFFIAEGNTYKFNSFAGLKKYGDTMVIRKLNGAIEDEGRYIR